MTLAPAAAERNSSNAMAGDATNKSVSRKFHLIMMSFFVLGSVYSQTLDIDTFPGGRVMLEKDRRFGLLEKKMVEYNESLSKKTRLEDGFRLMLLSTTDRNKAMSLRSRLLQLFPEHKVYSVFQTPYIKVKFGNFLDREEAEKMRQQLMSMEIVPGNIYVVPERVEVKPEKNKSENPEGN